MDGPPDDFGLLRFSTGNFPAGDRLDMWREILARKLLHLSVDPFTDDPFEAHAGLRILPELRIGWGSLSPCINRRSRRMAASDNDDFVLLVNLDGSFEASQSGRSVELGAGDSYLMACAEPSSFRRSAAGRILCVRFPGAPVAQLAPNLYDRVARIIPNGRESLILLTNYIRLMEKQMFSSVELRQAVTAHVYDLVSLTLNPTIDTAKTIESGGLGAGRLSAIMAYVSRNLGRADMSVGTVARHYHLSPRQVQRLFESEGSTFSEFLLTERLLRVRRVLTDPRLYGVSISTIVQELGFGDVSHFNRTFRRHFGASPSEIRERSRNGADADAAE